jgi:hypothetical protein
MIISLSRPIRNVGLCWPMVAEITKTLCLPIRAVGVSEWINPELGEGWFDIVPVGKGYGQILRESVCAFLGH